MNKKRIALVALALAVILSTVGVIYAAYLMTSNSVTVTVNPVQATLSLKVNGGTADSVTVGTSVTLVATCDDPTYAGIVTFTVSGAAAGVIGTPTASGGIATLIWTPSLAGTYTVVATANHT